MPDSDALQTPDAPVPTLAGPASGTSLGAYLTRVIWLAVLPVLLLAALFAVGHVRDAQRHLDERAMRLAEATRHSVERGVSSRLRGLKMLAASPLAADPTRLPALYDLAQTYVANYESHVVVSDADGQMLLNSRVPLGTALPRLTRPSGRGAAPRALATGQPAVSDLFISAVVGQPQVAVAVPVRRDGRSVGVVSSTFDGAFLRPLLSPIPLQAGWAITLRDSQGEVIASTREAAAEAAVRTYAAPSDLLGWSVVVEVPAEAAIAPTREAATSVAAALLLAAGLGLVGGHWAARRLQRSMAALAAGAAVPARGASVREVAAVRARLDDAAAAQVQAEVDLQAREQQRDQALADAVKARTLLQGTLARVSDGFVALDRAWRFTFVNRLAASIMGHDDEAALVGREIWEVFPEARNQPWHVAALRALASGEPEVVETRYEPRQVWFEARIFPSAEGLSIYFTDITARRQAEQALRASEQRYRLLFEANPGPMLLVDLETLRFLAVNDAAVWHYGYSREEFLALTAADIRPPDDLPRLREALAETENNPEPIARLRGRVRHLTKDGRLIDVELASSNLMYDGRRARLVSVVDVTERLAAERDRDEAAAARERAHRQFREVMSRVSEAFLALDRDLRFTYVNERALEIVGQPAASEVLGRRVWDFYPEIGLDNPVRLALERTLRGGQPSVVEHPAARRAGVWYESRIYPGAEGLSVYVTDITDRRRTAEALRASEQRYRVLFEANPNPMWVREANSRRILAVNEAAVAAYGYSRDELLSMTVADLQPESEHERLEAVLRRMHDESPPVVRHPGYWTHRRKDGSLFETEVASNALDYEGVPARLVVATDVSERVRLERENEAVHRRVQASEAQFRALFEHSMDMIYVGRPDGRIDAVNPAACRALGLTADEIRARDKRGFVDMPEDAVTALMAERDARGFVEFEATMVRGDGSRFPVEGTAVAFSDALGNRWVGGITRDISARRRAEAALLEREERLHLFVEHAPVALAMFDRDMRYLMASRRWRSDYGLDDRPLEGRLHYDIFPEIGDDLKDVHRRGLAGESMAAEESPFERADGRVQWVRWAMHPWHEADGVTVGGILIFTEDITARKETEVALAAQRAQLDAALANMLDAVYIADAEGRFVEVNEAYRQMFRFASAPDFVHSMAEFRELIEVFDLEGRPLPFETWPAPAALRGEIGRDVTRVIRRKDSGAIWYGSFTSSPIRDAAGAIVGAVVTARDVTQRVEDERALRASERDFRVLAEQIPAIVYRARTDPPGCTDWVSPRIVELGFTPEEWVGRPDLLWQVMHPDDRERVRAECERAFAEGRDSLHLEYRMRNARGGWRHVSDHAQVVRPADGSPPFVLGVNLDVSAAREAEAALRRNEIRFQTLAEQIPAIIYRAHAAPGQPALYVSPHIASLGYTFDEWTSAAGPNWRSTMHPDDLPRVLEAVARLQVAGDEVTLEYRLRDHWGRWRDIIDHGRIVDALPGEGPVFQGVMLEITPLKQSEKALREAEAYQRSLFESQADGVLLLDADFRILDANPAVGRMLRCEREALIGRDLRDFVVERDRPQVHGALGEMRDAAGGEPAPRLAEWEQLRADGSAFPAEVSARATARGRAVVVLRDVSERRAAQRALMAYQMELSELAQRLLTQERETTRHVAQTLHDRLGQSLTVARLRLDAAVVRMGPDMPPPMAQACTQVGGALDSAIGDVRLVLGELRPPMLEDQGLVAALDNEIRSRTLPADSVDVLLEVDEGRLDRRWPADVEYAAFMVAREAIVNAQMHAEATLVRVIVEGDERTLELQVVDDGRGIPAELQGGRPGHLGIVGMRERAIAIGAHFAVDQPPEGGTRIVLRWQGGPA